MEAAGRAHCYGVNFGFCGSPMTSLKKIRLRQTRSALIDLAAFCRDKRLIINNSRTSIAT